MRMAVQFRSRSSAEQQTFLTKVEEKLKTLSGKPEQKEKLQRKLGILNKIIKPLELKKKLPDIKEFMNKYKEDGLRRQRERLDNTAAKRDANIAKVKESVMEIEEREKSENAENQLVKGLEEIRRILSKYESASRVAEIVEEYTKLSIDEVLKKLKHINDTVVKGILDGGDARSPSYLKSKREVLWIVLRLKVGEFV